jgi:hypothetical protein
VQRGATPKLCKLQTASILFDLHCIIVTAVFHSTAEHSSMRSLGPRSSSCHRPAHISSSTSSTSGSSSSSSRSPSVCYMQASKRHLISSVASTDAQIPTSAGSSDSSTINSSLVVRRALLLGTAAGMLMSSSPAVASVKLTFSRKAQLKPYTLKAGYQVTVPDSWALAYVSHLLWCLPIMRSVMCCEQHVCINLLTPAHGRPLGSLHAAYTNM